MLKSSNLLHLFQEDFNMNQLIFDTLRLLFCMTRTLLDHIEQDNKDDQNHILMLMVEITTTMNYFDKRIREEKNNE